MEKEKEKINQDHLYDLLVSKEPSWQSIIYELVRTEQLDPWDIDIIVLTNKFLERIRQLQELEEHSFFISSKILLAAAILLRLKSEILYESVKRIEVLEEKKEVRLVNIPQIQIPEEDAETGLVLIPKTPLPRTRKVTLQELINALEKAINTEQRRIKKKLIFSRARKEIEKILSLPKLNLPQKIRELWSKLKNIFHKERKEKLLFSQLITNDTREDKIATFLPLIFLDHQKKIWLEQEKPFGDIEIWVKKPVKEEQNMGNELISC